MSKSTTLTVRTDPEHMLRLMDRAKKEKRKLASLATIILEEGIDRVLPKVPGNITFDKGSNVDFFNPYSIEHLKAYRHLEKTGFWPEGFVSDEMMKNCPTIWQVEIAAKMARAWIEQVEAGHVIGMPHFNQ